MSLSKRNTFLAIFLLAGVFLVINSCTHSPYVMPENVRTGDPNICFERDILPIFVSNCAKSNCHDAGSREEGYQLDSYNNIVKKGIVPGNVAASKIWQSIAIPGSGAEVMPPSGARLNTQSLSLIRRWIETGAIDSGACSTTNCDTNNYTYTAGIAPIMQKYCTGCHSTSASSGGSMADYNSVKTVALNGRLMGNITHQSGYNPMPPLGVTVSECEVTQIKKWIAAGTQNN